GVPSAVVFSGSSSLTHRATRCLSFSVTGIFKGSSLYSVLGDSSSGDSPRTHSLNQRRHREGGLASRSACSGVMRTGRLPLGTFPLATASRSWRKYQRLRKGAAWVNLSSVPFLSASTLLTRRS